MKWARGLVRKQCGVKLRKYEKCGGERKFARSVPQEAINLTPLIYPANSLWSVGRLQLIGIVGAFLWILLY